MEVLQNKQIGLFRLGEVVIYKFFYTLKLDGEGVEGRLHHRFHRSTSNVIVDSPSDKPLIFVQSVVLSTLVYLYLFQFDNPLITASSEFQMR